MRTETREIKFENENFEQRNSNTRRSREEVKTRGSKSYVENVLNISYINTYTH